MNSNKTITITLVSLLVLSAFIIGFLINRNFRIQIVDTPDPTQQINLNEFFSNTKQTNSPKINQEEISDTQVKYEVKKGDTLDIVAKLFGVSKASVIKTNNLKSENIKEGGILIIQTQ